MRDWVISSSRRIRYLAVIVFQQISGARFQLEDEGIPVSLLLPLCSLTDPLLARIPSLRTAPARLIACVSFSFLRSSGGVCRIRRLIRCKLKGRSANILLALAAQDGWLKIKATLNQLLAARGDNNRGPRSLAHSRARRYPGANIIPALVNRAFRVERLAFIHDQCHGASRDSR